MPVIRRQLLKKRRKLTCLEVGPVLRNGRFQSSPKIGNRVAFSPTGGDGVHEDLCAYLHSTSRCIQSSPVLNYAKYGKNFWSGDVGNGLGTEFGKNVPFKMV